MAPVPLVAKDLFRQDLWNFQVCACTRITEQDSTNILDSGISEVMEHKVRDRWCSYDEVLPGYTCLEMAVRVKVSRQND